MAVLMYDPTGQVEFGALVPDDGQRIPLCGRSLLIGSLAAECDIAIPENPSVAHQHCRISKAGGRVLLEALPGGANTQLNGSRVTSSDLNHGDVLCIGDLRLRYEAAAHARPTTEVAAPAKSGDAQWYAEIGGTYRGPLSLDELKARIDSQALSPGDYVKEGATGTPQPAGRIGALKPLFRRDEPETPSPAGPAGSPPPPAADEGWFVEIGGRMHGPLTQDEMAAWIAERRLNANDYVRSGEQGTPQPAGRTPELRQLFASLVAPTTTTTPADLQPDAFESGAPVRQSTELQDMFDALPESAVPADPQPAEPNATEPPPATAAAETSSDPVSSSAPARPKRKRKKKKGSGRAEKKSSAESDPALDAVLDDVLFSDEPPPSQTPRADSPTPDRPSPATEPESAAPAVAADSTPELPPPGPTQPPKPSRFKPPKPRKKKSGSGSGVDGSKLMMPAVGAGIVAVIVLAVMYWPTSYESNRPQLEKLLAISNEMHELVERKAPASAWESFAEKVSAQGKTIEQELGASELDLAGTDLHKAAKLLPEVLSEGAEGVTGKAFLFRQYVNRAKFLLDGE